MIEWFKNRFLHKKTAGIVEWRTEDSLFHFIAANLNDEGKLANNVCDLPDEKNDEDQLKFTAGLSDALFGTKAENAKKQVNNLANLLRKVAVKGHKESELEFYALITQNESPVSIMDEFLEAIVRKDLPTEPYLFSFAKDLVTKTNKRNAVKFGIAILGLCQNKTVVNELKILGLHEEFTLYSAIAIANLSDRPAYALWDLARKVDGWGKIQVVERLALVDIDQPIKDWLLEEGYKNSIMYEYLAYTCAVHGELHKKLQQPEISPQIFKGATDILDALLERISPEKNISAYSHAASAIKNFLRHSKQYTHEIPVFNLLHKLKDYLSELQKAPETCKPNDWNSDAIADCLVRITDLLNCSDWEVFVYKGLNSSDPITYHDAIQAAVKLGIDLWGAVWRKLKTNQTEPFAWFNVTHYSKPEHAEQIIDFALQHLPIDELATGPRNSSGFGPSYKKSTCLQIVLNYLGNYPGKGEKILLAGLKSPVTSNRNRAIASLNQWRRENWSPEIEKEITHLKDIEPNNETRANIEKLLNGEPLSM